MIFLSTWLGSMSRLGEVSPCFRFFTLFPIFPNKKYIQMIRNPRWIQIIINICKWLYNIRIITNIIDIEITTRLIINRATPFGLTDQDLWHLRLVIWKEQKAVVQEQSPEAHLWVWWWKLRKKNRFSLRMSGRLDMNESTRWHNRTNRKCAEVYEEV